MMQYSERNSRLNSCLQAVRRNTSSEFKFRFGAQARTRH
jgi:hypothetical protein